MKKNYKKTYQIEIRIEKVLKKVINYMLSGKVIIICLIAGSINKT